MLTLIAIMLAIVALGMFLVSPVWGFLAVLVVKPVIDTQWYNPIFLGFKLTEIYSVAVPVIATAHLLLGGARRADRHSVPLGSLWLLYGAVIAMFAAIIFYQSGAVAGSNIFFRYINGVVAFFFVQTYFLAPERQRLFFAALFLAGIFPVAVGLYQMTTGAELRTQMVEGLTRYAGFYHDVITPRYLALQTMLGLVLFAAVTPAARGWRAVGATYALGALAVLFRTYSKSGVAIAVLWAVTWITLRRLWGLGMVAGVVGMVVASGVMFRDALVDIGQLFWRELAFFAGDVEMEDTFNGRWPGWFELIAQWRAQPLMERLFGSGETALGAHNDYLQMLVHGGMFGLMVYAALLVSIGIALWRAILRDPNPVTVGALMALEMWLVDSIGLVPSAYPAYQWFIWGLIGLALRLDYEGRATRPAGAADLPTTSGSAPVSRWVIG